jgi:hypothetical protein
METEYEKLDANSSRFAMGDNSYRFVLGESHQNDKNPLIFICINPSIATHKKLDPTSKRVKAISKINNHDSWIMLNVCSQRAEKPKDLAKTCDSTMQTMHKKNIEVIKEYVKGRSTVVAAWGVNIKKRKYLIDCLAAIVKELEGIAITWMQIDDSTERVHPRHPSRVPKEVELKKFDIKDYMKKN